MQLHWIDYAIMLVYVTAVISIGFALKRYMKTSADFFLSGRSIPAWVAGLAFISANLGALELVGMAASGAKYGIATCHFYWLGAIPAMVFLGVFMMPFYYGSKARSVPEYLHLRFDGRTRCLNSLSFAVMTLFASGISMNALAKLLHSLLGWDYAASLWICSAVVLVYVLKGGLTSAIYTEVLQFFMIVLGFSPVVYLGMREIGGWDPLAHALHQVAAQPAVLGLAAEGKSYAPGAWTEVWRPILAGPSANPMGVDWVAVFCGLGFVSSFGYWCTNFLVVQRAMAARDMKAARRTPLIAAVPKMFFPVLVILPGMLAVALAYTGGGAGREGYQLPTVAIRASALPQAVELVRTAASAGRSVDDFRPEVEKITGLRFDPARFHALASNAPSLDDAALRVQVQDAVADRDYDGVILSLVKRYCPPGLMGLALTALLASFMSGMAGNVTAFNAVWTYDIYQAYLAPGRSDAHYVRMGRIVTVAGIVLSIACAYVASRYSNAMDIVQLVFGFVNAPLFATFLFGMFWKRATSHGAFYGLLGGMGSAACFHGVTLAQGNLPGIKGGWIAPLQYLPSEMAQNFWLSLTAFIVCAVLTVGISLATRRTKGDGELAGLVYSLTPRQDDGETRWYLRPGFLGLVLLAACLVLNIVFF